MDIPNNTHYFTHNTKVINSVSEVDSFRYESSRRQSYMQRLYFEYLDVQRKGGLVFFYTLTYNNKSMPYYLGRSCFSYKDIRYITNGALSKWLLRNHKCKLRYLCACERGEGKGKRGFDSEGLGNNPHYHFVFFLHPLDGASLPTPQQFQLELNKLWQGSTGFTCWKTAKFGHCQPGNNLGLVTSSDAFGYVCKYVCKDVAEREYEDFLRKKFESECYKRGITNDVLYNHYLYLKDTTSWCQSKQSYFDAFYLHEFISWRKRQISPFGLFDFYTSSTKLQISGVGKKLKDFITDYWKDVFIPRYVDICLSNYRREFSGKVRCSKSLGEYGLNYVYEANDGVKVKISSPNGYKVQPACLYYVRKKYYRVFKCSVTGNVLYRLNEDGINYKCEHLLNSVRSLGSKLREYYSCGSVISDDSFVVSFDSVFSRPDIDEVLRRYSVYLLVYKHRYYVTFDRISLDDDCSFSKVILDYRKFLTDSSYVIDYDSNTIDSYFADFVVTDDLLSFQNHPAFLDYKVSFEILDILLSHASTYFDSIRKAKFSERSDFQKRHNSLKFNML